MWERTASSRVKGHQHSKIDNTVEKNIFPHKNEAKNI